MTTRKITLTIALGLVALIPVNAQNGFVVVANTNYEWMDGCFENRIAFKQDGKYGYCDSLGKVVIPAQYANFYQYSNGFAKVTNDKTNYFYIDKKGNEVTNNNKEYITPISNGEYYQVKDGKILFYDKLKNVKGDIAGKLCGDYADGMIAVLNNDNLWGFADLSPKIVIPCEYKSFGNFTDGLAVVSKGGYSENKTGVINTKGEVVIPLEYHLIFRLKNYLLLEKNQQYTAFDITNGSLVKEPLDMKYYGYMNLFNRNFKIAKNAKGELALFNDQLKQECSINYDDCRFADDETGLVAVKKNNLWGMIDRTGKELIECKYDDISACYNGLIKVEKGGIQGFADRTGKLIIPLQFKNSNSFYSRSTTATYKGSLVVLRPKTAAELKTEEQLIAQKKLPTADECYEMALVDAGLKVKPQTTVAKANNDFDDRNRKEQLLARQVANYVKYVDWYNEAVDKLIKELTACMKAPITKTCTNEHWRHTNDAYGAWISITKDLKRLKAELAEIKKINYGYLCSNNNSSIAKSIESNLKNIDVLLNGYEITINADLKYLQSSSIEGADFAKYANELKSFNEFKFKKISPQMMTITASSEELIKLIAGCK